MKKISFLILLVIGLISCNQFGNSVKYDNLTIYYKNGATESDAKKVGELFTKLSKEFNADIQVAMEGSKYIIKVIHEESIATNYGGSISLSHDVFDTYIKIIIIGLSSSDYLNTDKLNIEVQVCNKHFEKQRTITAD
jgi:hypothetical protein